MKFTIGQKVVAKKLGWMGNGSKEFPIKRCDVIGTITSIKGISPDHINIKLYEFTWSGGKFYNDGDRLNDIK
jgi:hypothetical protein